MKYTYVFLCYLLQSHAFSQKELNIDSYYGYAVGTTYSVKKVMISRELTVGLESKINYGYHYLYGLGMNTVQCNSPDIAGLSAFNTVTFINSFANIRRYYTVNRKSTSFAYIDFGLLLSYLIKTKSEVINNGQNNRFNRSNLGLNIGLSANFSFKTLIAKNTFLNLGLYNSTDYIMIYRHEEDKIKLDTRMLKIGFTLVL